ncbi:major facilitator superfamily domain-containing protein [Xylaria curta]|nr:major facilitator superfamily domain-containing protein [Xylaria curta]
MSDSPPIEKESNSGKGLPELPPEEGLHGWLCVVGGFFCLFCTFGFLAAIGVFQTIYQETTLRNYSPSDISWIFAVQLSLMWAPGPLFGRLVDTYGPAPVLYPCAILCTFALAITSLAEEYYQIFLAQGLAFGIGSGGIFTTAFVCVGQWFQRRRGLAIGITSTGSSLGGVIFPIFLDRIIKRVGFYGAIRYTALLVGLLLAASCFLVRARLPRKKWNPDLKWFDFSLFKQAQFAFLAIGSFMVMWGLWGPFDFITSMAIDAGFDSTLALYLISIINAASVPGRIIPPHLADKVGHYNVVTVCSLCTGISTLALWLPFYFHPSHAGIIVFALVYGFVSGAVVSLLMPCAAKAGSLETLGQRFGTFQFIIGISCLTGLPIMGAILDRQGGHNYSGLQIFSGTACLLGGVLLAISTYILSRSRKSWNV